MNDSWVCKMWQVCHTEESHFMILLFFLSFFSSLGWLSGLNPSGNLETLVALPGPREPDYNH